jgi:hypothetical protein
VTLPASEVTVSSTAEPGRVNCSFRCPECGVDGDQHCDVSAGRLLLLGGAQVKRAKAPLPPLGLADLVLLRELLNRPDFATLMGRAR